jgi:ATP-binding cassette, subfamily C, bacterial
MFHIFWNAPGGRPISVVLSMLLASICEMLGMGAIVPLVSQANAGDGGANSIVTTLIRSIFETVGLSYSFTTLLLFLGAALILKSVTAFLAMRYVAISGADVTTKLRMRLLSAATNARWSYFVNHKPGEVSAMVATQANAAGEAFLSTAFLVTNSISGLGLLIAAAVISFKLVIVSLVSIVALAYPLNFVLKLAGESGKQQFKISTELTSGVQDAMNNMKPLKSMGRQHHFVEKFSANILDLRQSLIRVMVSQHGVFHGQDILGAIMLLVGIYVSIVVLNTPLSEMLAVGIIFYQVVDLVKRMQLNLQNSTVATQSYSGVMDTVMRAEAEVELDVGTIVPELERGIKFEDVSFAYGKKMVLNHVNLDCAANEITVLIGPSGAGKTTIVDLMIGFNLPQKGRLTIDGVDMKDVQLSAWRSKIGYVPQELTMLRGTIADNIRLGEMAVSNEAIIEALRLANALAFVEALPDGINSDIGTMGAKLSGGQRQRLSLARALVLKPKLLLLDEVTSALDDTSEAEICENIKTLAGQFTIVAITHKPAWKLIADRIYNVSGGKVERVAKPKAKIVKRAS